MTPNSLIFFVWLGKFRAINSLFSASTLSSTPSIPINYHSFLFQFVFLFSGLLFSMGEKSNGLLSFSNPNFKQINGNPFSPLLSRFSTYPHIPNSILKIIPSVNSFTKRCAYGGNCRDDILCQFEQYHNPSV